MIERLLEAARSVASDYGYERVEVSHLLFVLLGYPEVDREVVSRAGRCEPARRALQAGFRRHDGAATHRLDGVVSDGVVRCLEAAKGANAPLVAALDVALTSDGRLVQDAVSAAGLVFPDNAPEPVAFVDPVPDLDDLLDGVEFENPSAEGGGGRSFFEREDPFSGQEAEKTETRDPLSRNEEHAPGKRNKGGGKTDLDAKEQAEALRAAQRATTDISRRHANGETDPVLGRDAEIDRVCEILMRRRKSNVLLVGEPGVGKTALVEGVAAKVAKSSDVALSSRPVLQASLGALVAGARYRGDFESRLEILVDSARESRAILFFDEMQMLVGAGATAERGMDGANMLKPALARDGLSVIGATTHEEMEQISADPALMRRFEVIRIREPGLAVMRDILPGAAAPYLSYHVVSADARTLDRVIDFSDRYLEDRRFPDKAFDVLDGACVSARVHGRSKLLVSDIRAAVRRLGGSLPVVSEAVRMGSRLRERAVHREIERHVGGHEAAIRNVAQVVGATEPGSFLSLVLEGPSGVGRKTMSRALSHATGMRHIEINADLSCPEMAGSIISSLNDDPSTLFCVDVDAVPGPEERGFLEDLARQGSSETRSGHRVSLGEAALVLRRGASRSNVGFVPVTQDGPPEDDTRVVRMSLFSGGDLLDAVTFELSRLSRVWSDAGVSRPVPDPGDVVSRSGLEKATWDDVRRACAKAVKDH